MAFNSKILLDSLNNAKRLTDKHEKKSMGKIMFLARYWKKGKNFKVFFN